MPKPRLREFDRQLRSETAPKLANYDFVPGDHRTFRRVVPHEGTVSTQIIEFQVGTKSFSGMFTVNLGVFNPEYTPKPLPAQTDEPHSYDCLFDLLSKRLGFLRTPRTTLLDRLLGRRPIAEDYWWKQHADARSMKNELADVEQLLLTDGLEWLRDHTSLCALHSALEILEWRKRRLSTSDLENPPRGS